MFDILDMLFRTNTGVCKTYKVIQAVIYVKRIKYNVTNRCKFMKLLQTQK